MAQTNSGDKENLNVSQSQQSSISGQLSASQPRISSASSFSAMSTTNGSCDNAITSGAIQSTAALSADSNSADTSPGASTNKSLPSTSQSVINNTANSMDSTFHNQPWLEGGQSPWDFPSDTVNFPSSSFNSDPSGKWSSSLSNAWESQTNPPKSKSQATDWGFSTQISTTAGNSSTQSQAAWALPTTNNSDEVASAWGHPKQRPNTGTDGWGQPTTTSSNPSNNGAQAQWGSTPQTTSSWGTPTSNAKLSESQSSQSSQWDASGKSSPPVTSQSSDIPTSKPADSAPTSWAGAAAKGLPKVPVKTPEVDPMQNHIDQMINNPEGWGKIPIRQDSSWGKPPEKKNQDDSNTWQAAPNNGTAIWEASKSGESNNNNTNWEDKSAWNQKVVGNNDPNVWNGEGQKGKDNNLWDNIPTSKESEPSSDQTSQWQGAAAALPNRTISQSSGDNSENGWSAGNGPSRTSPPNNHNNWSSSAQPTTDRQSWGGPPPNRSHSTSDAAAWSEPPIFERQNSGWNQGASGAGTHQGNWTDHQNVSGPGGWGDNQSNQWGGPHNQPRKPSNNYGCNWDDGNERSRRNPKSESDANWDDADMGDWNESNSVWSSASGFKRPSIPAAPRHATIPENAMSAQKMTPRMHNNYSAPNQTRSQMIEQLIGMGFNKQESTGAIIACDMNLQAAVNMLCSGNSYHGDPNSMSGSAFEKFNPNIPPPNLHMMNNNQMKGGMPAHNRKHSMPMHPMGAQNRTPVVPQNQQTKLIVQQLQKAVNFGLIRANILTIPLSENTLRSITTLLQMYQQYQTFNDQVIQAHRIPGYMSQQKIETTQANMLHIKNQMNQLQQTLLSRNPSMMRMADGVLPDQMGGLTMMSGAGTQQGGGLGTSSSQSRLSKWVNDDKAPGSKQNIHSSQSTPNLQGSLGEPSPWSNSNSCLNSGWSASPSYLDNSHDSTQMPTTSTNGPQATFEIPEFVPGQPWQGGTGSKLEDDPAMTPGSVARSLSVNTASQSGRLSTDSGWNGMNGGRGTWSNDTSSPNSGDSWKQPRPPPGLRGNINRSKSMPQGPSDKNSFSPVMSDWDSPQGVWLVLRNLTPQIDSSTLKTLCRQHGPLQHFFVNQSLGQALVKYESKAEGQKAQKSLNQCSLSNTTIMSEFVNSHEAQRIIEGMQLATGRGGSAQPNPASLWSGSSNTSNNYFGAWGGGPSLLENGMTSSLSPGGYMTTSDFQ